MVLCIRLNKVGHFYRPNRPTQVTLRAGESRLYYAGIKRKINALPVGDTMTLAKAPAKKGHCQALKKKPQWMPYFRQFG